MLALQCDPQIGRLKSDYREVCPDRNSLTTIYSTLFIFLYAFGIPVFMHVAMRAHGIVGIVKEKMDAAKFQAMLSLFIKNATSVEAHRMARLVSTVKDDLEFERQTKQALESWKCRL